jgi:hypothetical protein
MFFRDWLLRHPPTSVLLVLAFLALLMGLFPGSQQRPAAPTRIQEVSGMDPGTATVTTKALDLAAQIDAVFSAPIPFFLALVAILGVALLGMWRALEWAYRMRLEKADFYIKMAGQEHAPANVGQKPVPAHSASRTKGSSCDRNNTAKLTMAMVQRKTSSDRLGRRTLFRAPGSLS